MKPITNILLILALVCYVFLPFRTMELTGSITGFTYTAGLITENFSFWKTLFALLPFIACFGAIALNCMKHRYWGIAAGLFIIAGLVFYHLPELFENMPINHAADVVADVPGQEGLPVKELNFGYYSSYTLMWLSLISCIVSLMPFKFNTVLERSIDDTIEHGLNKVQKEIHDEFSHLESKMHHKDKKQEEKPVETEAPAEAPKPKVENPADYMPPGSVEDSDAQKDTTNDGDNTSSEPSDDDKYSAYMPK